MSRFHYLWQALVRRVQPPLHNLERLGADRWPRHRLAHFGHQPPRRRDHDRLPLLHQRLLDRHKDLAVRYKVQPG